LVHCPPDSEKEAGLSYGKVVPVVTVASLILFNAAMFAQFLLLKVNGPAAIAGICLALSIFSCIAWAGITVRDKRRTSVAGSGSHAGAGHVKLDVAHAPDESKERALLVSEEFGCCWGVGGSVRASAAVRLIAVVVSPHAPSAGQPHAPSAAQHLHPA
jgi:hypothetical protein